MEFKDRFRGYLPIVVDLETAGVNPQKHAVLEIAVVTLDWVDNQLQCAESFLWSVAPHESTSVDAKSLSFNRIDPFDPDRDAKSEELAVRECFRIVRKCVKQHHCQRAVLTGHNAHFDRLFLKQAQSRNGIGRDPFHPFTVLDTASIAAVAYGQTVLRIACDHAGIQYDSEQAHSAQYDAWVTAQLFCTIVNESNYLQDWSNQSETSLT